MHRNVQLLNKLNRKKFQKLEKELVKQLNEEEKAHRGKAQLFSKQTAQRQK